MTKDKALVPVCCDCGHFRMWKPEPEFCTVKKARVDPLKKRENCFILRRGLRFINLQDFTGGV